MPGSLGLVVVQVPQKAWLDTGGKELPDFKRWRRLRSLGYSTSWMYGGNMLLFYLADKDTPRDSERNIDGIDCRLWRDQSLGTRPVWLGRRARIRWDVQHASDVTGASVNCDRGRWGCVPRIHPATTTVSSRGSMSALQLDGAASRETSVGGAGWSIPKGVSSGVGWLRPMSRILWYELWYDSYKPLFLLIYWRRGRDSNPRYPCKAHTISSRAQSATLSPLQSALYKRFDKRRQDWGGQCLRGCRSILGFLLGLPCKYSVRVE